MSYAYDIKCENLAQDFLEDEGEFTVDELQELAQMIQDTIERYLDYGRKKRNDTSAINRNDG